MDVVTYALSRKYTDNSIAGTSGVLAGKNCTIASITPVDGGNLVTFEWVADDSTTHTDTMFVKDGILGANDIAPTYDPTESYSVGDLVVYNNELYRCTSTTTGDFDPNDWESISIDEILSEIEIALASKADSSAIPTDLADLADDSTHRTVTDAEKVSWDGKADTSDIPTALSDLTDDSTHRVVSDTEKATWNAKSDFSGSYNDLTDKPTIPSDADDISYDNTESGLTADDVQGAIDEVNGNIVDVEANPSGTATGELETIKVGSTIYNIVGGEPVYGEASGSVANFADGSANPLADLKIAINPVQAGSGDPSPSNPRPISGWTGASVNVKGANVWDEEWENGVYNTSTGLPSPNTNCIRSKNKIKVKPSSRCYLKIGQGLTDVIRMIFYDKDENYISSNTSSIISNSAINIPNNCFFMNFYCSSDYGNTYNNDISINYPSSDTEYHAYVGTTVPVSWQTEAGTVYGGELDVTSGGLTSNIYQKVKIKDVSRWETVSIGGHNIFRGRGLTISKTSFSPSSKCEVATTNSTLSTNNSFTMGYTGFYMNDVLIRMDDYATIESFLEAVGDYSFIYEVQTPTTYQLTPTQVSSILGVNNIWSNTGDVEVKYQRDLNACINDIIRRIEALENA